MEDLFLDPVPHTWSTPAPHRSSEPRRSVDESSVDLYGDLSLSSIKSDQTKNYSSPEKYNRRHFSKISEAAAGSGSQLTSETLPDVPASHSTSYVDLDLYTDHLVAELSLKERLAQTDKELLRVKNQNAQLLKNISSLYLTAKHEIQDKDAEIAKLRGLLEKQKEVVEKDHLRDKRTDRSSYSRREPERSKSRDGTTSSSRRRADLSDDKHNDSTERNKSRSIEDKYRQRDSGQNSRTHSKGITKEDSLSAKSKSQDVKTSSVKNIEDLTVVRNIHRSERNINKQHSNENKYERLSLENSSKTRPRNFTKEETVTEKLDPSINASDASLPPKSLSVKDKITLKRNLPAANLEINRSSTKNESVSNEKRSESSQLTDLRQKLKKRKLEAERQCKDDHKRESKRQKTDESKRHVYNSSSNCKKNLCVLIVGPHSAEKTFPSKLKYSANVVPRGVILAPNEIETIDTRKIERKDADRNTVHPSHAGEVKKKDMSTTAVHSPKLSPPLGSGNDASGVNRESLSDNQFNSVATTDTGMKRLNKAVSALEPNDDKLEMQSEIHPQIKVASDLRPNEDVTEQIETKSAMPDATHLLSGLTKTSHVELTHPQIQASSLVKITSSLTHDSPVEEEECPLTSVNSAIIVNDNKRKASQETDNTLHKNMADAAVDLEQQTLVSVETDTNTNNNNVDNVIQSEQQTITPVKTKTNPKQFSVDNFAIDLKQQTLGPVVTDSNSNLNYKDGLIQPKRGIITSMEESNSTSQHNVDNIAIDLEQHTQAPVEPDNCNVENIAIDLEQHTQAPVEPDNCNVENIAIDLEQHRQSPVEPASSSYNHNDAVIEPGQQRPASETTDCNTHQNNAVDVTAGFEEQTLASTDSNPEQFNLEDEYHQKPKHLSRDYMVRKHAQVELTSEEKLAEMQHIRAHQSHSASKASDTQKVAPKEQIIVENNLTGGQLFEAVAKSCGGELSRSFAFLGPEILNQESNSVASSVSMPFKNVKSVDGNSVSNIASTNQTWPFEASASNQNSNNSSFAVRKFSNQQSPSFDKNGKNQLFGDHDKDGRSFQTESKRAFPISSCLKENSVERNQAPQEGGPPESENSSGDSRSSSSSGKDSTSSNSNKANSEKSGSGSASSDCGEVNLSPTSKGTHAIETPQKDTQEIAVEPNPRSSQGSDGSSKVPGLARAPSGSSNSSSSAELEKTPHKLTPTKPDEMGIVCTSNLIMLGDEETTCTTFASPHKPSLLPSEFYPPGVRGKMHEGGSHSRHIRGESEVVFKPIRPLYPEESKGGRFKAIFEEREEEEKVEPEETSSNDSVIFVKETDFGDTELSDKENIAGQTSSSSSDSHHNDHGIYNKTQSVTGSFNISKTEGKAVPELPTPKQDPDCFVLPEDEACDEFKAEKEQNSKPLGKKDIDNVVRCEDGTEDSMSVSEITYRNNLKILKDDALASKCCCQHSQLSLKPQFLSDEKRDEIKDWGDGDDEESGDDSEQKPGFKAYLDVVQTALFNVKKQDLKTYKQSLIEETFSRGYMESQNEMRKELEKLRREFHEFQRASLGKSSPASCSQQRDTVEFHEFQRASLGKSSPASCSQQRDRVESARPVDTSLPLNNMSQSQLGQLPENKCELRVSEKAHISVSGFCVQNKHSDSNPLELTDYNKKEQCNHSTSAPNPKPNDQVASALSQRKTQYKQAKSETRRSVGNQRNTQLGICGRSRGKLMSSKVKDLRSTAPCGWRASPESCVVTSSDCGKTGSLMSHKTGSERQGQPAGTTNTQLHREPDSTSDNHGSITPEAGVKQNNRLMSGSDSPFITDHEKTEVKTSHPTTRLIKQSPPELDASDVSPFKRPRHVFNAPPIIDECSQFPSPVRLLRTSTKCGKNGGGEDSKDEAEAEDRGLQSVVVKQDQHEEAVFSFDESSFCSHSLSEFDKDVLSGSCSPKAVNTDGRFQSSLPLSSSTPSSRPFARISKTQKSLDEMENSKVLPLEQVIPAQLSKQPFVPTECKEQSSVTKSNNNPVSSPGNITENLKNSECHSKQAAKALPTSNKSQVLEQKFQAEKTVGKDCVNLRVQALSRHCTYDDLHKMRLVKTKYQVHQMYEDCSSPINVLESTTEESDGHFDSPLVPQVSKDEWQFIQNVKRVRKNLSSELNEGKNLVPEGPQEKQIPSLSQSPIHDVFSPCSARTLSSDLFISGSESEGFPSPVKKAKVSGPMESKEKSGWRDQGPAHITKAGSSPALGPQFSPVGSLHSDSEDNEDKTQVGESEMSPVTGGIASPHTEEPEEGEIEDEDEEEEVEAKHATPSAKDQSSAKFSLKSHFAKTDKKSSEGVQQAPKKKGKLKRIRPVLCKNSGSDQSTVSPLERVYAQEKGDRAQYSSGRISPVFFREPDKLVPSSSRADLDSKEGRNRNQESRDRSNNRPSTKTHSRHFDRGLSIPEKRAGQTSSTDRSRNRVKDRNQPRNYVDLDRPNSSIVSHRIEISRDADSESKRDSQTQRNNKIRLSSSSKDGLASEQADHRHQRERPRFRNSSQEIHRSRRSYEESSQSRNDHRERSKSRNSQRRSGSPRNS